MATVEALVTKLRELGGSANNPSLKRALGVEGEEWELIKKSALRAGVVLPGKGFGGKLTLADNNQQKPHKLPHTFDWRSSLKGKRVVVLDKELQPRAFGTISEFNDGESVVTIMVE